MGCGVRVPVRSSPLALVSSYRYVGAGPAPLLEKRNRAHVINATIDGRWHYKNGAAAQAITPGTVIVADKGDGYACAHSNLTPNSCLIVNLSNTAVDDDAGPVFGRRILTMPVVPSLIRRACAADGDEQFHSRVFEIFDFVSNVSRPIRAARDRQLLRIQSIKRFIEYNVGERITLADIAGAVGLSPFVCLRIFKRATGLTPGAYLAKCRIEQASQLLKRSNVEISAVAERCGFSDQAYFARFFKNYTGQAPTQYRRQAQR